MKEFFSKLKYLNLLFIAAYVSLGICLILRINVNVSTVLYVFGAMLVVSCIIRVIDFFMYRFEVLGLIYGILCGILGVVVLATTQVMVANAFIMQPFAIFFVIKGLFAIEDSYDYRTAGDKLWWMDTIFALIVEAWGITLFMPMLSNYAYILIGSALVTVGVLHTTSIILVASTVKRRVLPRDKNKLDGKEVVIIDEDRPVRRKKNAK